MENSGGSYDRLYLAILTPYKDHTDTPDEVQLRAFLRQLLQPKYIDSGLGLIINPEAGEVAYLSKEEKRRNAEIAVDEIKGRIPIFAGVSHPTTAGTVEDAIDAKKAGVNGLFVMPPIGMADITTNWDSVRYPEVWIDMIKEVVKAVGDMPLIVHASAKSTEYGGGLPLEPTIQMCKAIPNIVGWKMVYDYTGYVIIARALRKFDRHISLLGCRATNFHANLACGQIDGMVCGSLNFAHAAMIDHFNAWRVGDWKEAQRIWDGGLAALQEYIYAEPTRLHIRYKIATWLAQHISNPFMRPPLPRPRKNEIQRIRELLVNTGIQVIDSAKVSSVMESLEM